MTQQSTKPPEPRRRQPPADLDAFLRSHHDEIIYTAIEEVMYAARDQASPVEVKFEIRGDRKQAWPQSWDPG
jgi:hypothetical protein